MSKPVITAQPMRKSKSKQLKSEKAIKWRCIQQYREEIEKERAIFVQKITVTVAPADCEQEFSAIVDSRRGIRIKK